jgi:hypothetical protein
MTRIAHCVSGIASHARLGVILIVCLCVTVTSSAQWAPAVAERNGPLPGPLPLFPSNNWWNQDISQAPVDARSAELIAFIGTTRGMHPDFGGLESPGSHNIYGMPYIVVGADQPKRTVQFDYWRESDGVNLDTGQSFPFYPIPDQAITEPYWIEGGPPGNAGVGGDRHMLIVDRDNKHLYELFALRWSGTEWEAGSGAFFDMKTNGRRPEGWTSADAAGLAILPGLVRYDEVFGPDEIRHAFRVSVRGVFNYVWPASHRANTNPAGPPLGARLRLKASKDISGYPPYIQKIFRAMKTHGLIVADTGSDLYVQGVFDTRWNNDQLNPAFRALKGSDFEVIQLGWRGDTGPCLAPGAPRDFAATANGLVASMSWRAPESGGPVTDYVVEAGSSSGTSNLATLSVGQATSYSVSGPAGTYYLRARARNGCGSTVSNEVVLSLTSTCTAPGVPGAPVAVVNGSQVSLSWSAASGASSHVFEAGSAPGLANLVNVDMPVTSLSASAPPGVYYVRTRGRNACGTGAASAETVVSVGGCTAPGAPASLNFSLAGRLVTLTWVAAGGASDYLLEAGSASGLSDVLVTPIAGTSVSAMAPPGRYHVRVRARNACGASAATNEVLIVVP